MTTYSVRYIVAGAEQREVFATSSDAWAFMRKCAADGICAGYPQPSTWDAAS